GPCGKASLLDLFDGRLQLVLYHFMFGPGSDPCTGCSSFADNIGHLAHLHARNTSLVLVSRAPLREIERFKRRMGWTVPWFPPHASISNKVVAFQTRIGRPTGLGVFRRDGEGVYRTSFTSPRGTDRLRMDFNLLALTPLGRQEAGETSPGGGPKPPPYYWWWK